MDKQFLALISVDGAGSFFRDTTEQKAIDGVARVFKSDFKGIVKIKKGTTVKVNIFEFDANAELEVGSDGVRFKGVRPVQYVPRKALVDYTYKR